MSSTLTAVRPDALPRVNLLPPEIAQRRRFRRVQRGLGATVVAAAAAVGGLYLAATGSVNDAQGELDQVTADRQRLTAQADEYAAVPAVYAAVSAAEAQLVQAMGQEVRWSYYLNDLGLTIPAETWLTQLSISQTVDGATAVPAAAAGATGASGTAGIGQIQFSGKAMDHDDVAAWLDALAKQRGYADPYLTNSAKELIGKREVVGFTSQVTITADALSKRYTEQSGN